MVTQVEVYGRGDFRVFWLPITFEDRALVTTGRRLVVESEGEQLPWTIARVFVSLPDDSPLPPKARTGTINSFLQKDGTAEELQAAMPRIYVH